MLVFDIETNGLLHDATELHCLVIFDVDEGSYETFNNQKDNKYPIHTGLQRLEDADYIVGHNIINFDLPVIHSIYSWFNPRSCPIDTLILSRLFHPNMVEIDHKRKDKGLNKHMPLQLYGRHSLEAWGHRLNEYKGEFGKTTDWKAWSPEMELYCEQDVAVTTKLCEHFHPYLTGLR
tara:strand:- start:1 stop:531 length:531 start_codon:yes stop_codon:yes gene_type:complete